MSSSSPSFEEDMRLIREKRNISRETLHRQTKVALENIELFEEGELDRHPHFNEVYLRALVRAYAEVLDISKEMALHALDQSRASVYSGELGDVYLDREGSKTADEEELEEDDSGAGAGVAGVEETVDAPIDRDIDQEKEAGSSEEPDRIAEDLSEGEVEEEEVEGEGDDGRAGGDEPPDIASTPRSGGGEQSPVAHRPSPVSQASGGIARRFLMEGTGKAAMGVGGLVLVALVVWALATVLSDSSAPESPSTEAPEVADTVNNVQAEEAPTPVAVIGDSLDFTVFAVEGKLEPIRVKIDDGSWNPYWIEQGDSMSFAAGEEFALRHYLPRAGLRIESMDWPIRATDRYDTLIVSHQHVQGRIDSLSAVESTR